MTAAALYAALTRPVPVVALQWHELPKGWRYQPVVAPDADTALARYREAHGKIPQVIYRMPRSTYYFPVETQPGMDADELIGS